MALPFEELVCKRPGCRELVRRKRLAQLYCSERCRNAVVQGRKRRKQAQQSGDAKGTDRGILGSGDGQTKNINEINAVQVGFLGGVPLLGDGRSLPSGWKGKLRLNLHDEAPGIGCGWRTLTVQVGPRRVSLCNHHTGDAARVGREVFERVVVGSGDCVLRSVAPRPEPPPEYANTARSWGEGRRRKAIRKDRRKVRCQYAIAPRLASGEVVLMTARTASLAQEAPSDIADALGDLAVDADTLLGMLARGLSKISNRLAALAPEASPELGDAVGFAAVDLDRHTAIVEVLVMRQTLNSERDPHERTSKT